MNTNTILDTIMTAIPDATLVRNGNSTFLAVPTGEADGVPTYTGVKVWSLSTTDRGNSKAFDFEAGVEAYKEFAAKQVDKANKPKKSSGPDPKKEAERAARRDSLMKFFMAHPGEEMTASLIQEGCPALYPEQHNIMTAGSDAKWLAEQYPDNFTLRTEKTKKFYTYNA